MPLPEALTLLDRTMPDCVVPTYWYEGKCPRSGAWLKLPRTDFVEAIAGSFMRHLSAPQYNQEGKMYGVLLVKTTAGELGILKAFSGLLNGESHVPGWVPPIAGREQIALEEAQTLAALGTIRDEILRLEQIPQRQTYAALHQQFEAQLKQLAEEHQARKELRSCQRQIHPELSEILNQQSQKDGIEKRNLKHQRDQILQPLQQAIQTADERIRALKQRRKLLSQKLQSQMHTAYRLTNFWGESVSLSDIVKGVMPTGTGDCCAPKLLNYAALYDLEPIAMAEFWWGSHERTQGEFYGACADRCQPLMGFLLSGLRKPPTLPILYEDNWLMAVDKPAGLLSVPGRSLQHQDCVLKRLQIPDLWIVHRLDQDTSGILLIAKDIKTYQHLSQQFQHRQVEKIYEAVLLGAVTPEQGTIDLPLWSDPCDRPLQKVDFQKGKPSTTHYCVMAKTETTTRVEFKPVTGRTHQLRVHAAVGLGAAILGDRLYGKAETRLHLHARALRFEHPQTGDRIQVQAETPF